MFKDGSSSVSKSVSVKTCSKLYTTALNNKAYHFALKGYDMQVYGYTVTKGTNIPLTGVNNNYWGMGISIGCTKAANSRTMTMVVKTHLRHWDGWPVKLSNTTTIDLNNTTTVEYYYRYIFSPTTVRTSRQYGSISKYGANAVASELVLWKRNGVIINEAQHTRIKGRITTIQVFHDPYEVYETHTDLDRNYVIFVSNWREKDTNDCYFRGWIGIKIDAANGTIQIGNITHNI